MSLFTTKFYNAVIQVMKIYISRVNGIVQRLDTIDFDLYIVHKVGNLLTVGYVFQHSLQGVRKALARPLINALEITDVLFSKV